MLRSLMYFLVFLLTIASLSGQNGQRPETSIIRPQEPKAPLSYIQQDLNFKNPIADITLSGTLTLPDTLNKSIPLAILISGSGTHDRNAEIYGHKPFLIIADRLAQQGIGSYRFDDRGVAKSQGSFSTATSDDFKDDVIFALAHLKRLGYTNIGLIGHSEGGMIAPIVATQSDQVKFIILLAAPGIPIKELMLKQNKVVLQKLMSFDEQEIEAYITFLEAAYNLVDQRTIKDSLYAPLKKLCATFYETRTDAMQYQYGDSSKDFYAHLAALYFQPWFRYFINFDPGPYLQKTTCPILALNGNMDIQVHATDNLNGIRKHLEQSQHMNYRIVEMDSINHLFQKTDTWDTESYSKIEETFNPEVLELMIDWINDLKFKTVKKNF